MKKLLVLDVGRLIAGPVIATILGDLGADVIKVEQPGLGDPLRHSHVGSQIREHMSNYWLVEGRNKLPVTLNLKHADGQGLLKRLAGLADVLVDNAVPGQMEKWGLGPEDLWQVNPGLVYVRVSGYGQDGPYRDQPSTDRTAIAFAGLAHLTGYGDGPPIKSGLFIADYCAAMLGTIGALEALRRRDSPGGTGRGELVDVSLYDALLRMAEGQFVDYSAAGMVRQRDGGKSYTSAPSGFYLSKDERWVAIMARGSEMFTRLVEATDGAIESTDGIPAEIHRRTKRPQIEAAMTTWVSEHDASEVVERLTKAGICVSMVNTVADIMRDPHVAARGDLISFEDPEGNSLTMQAAVPRLSGGSGEFRHPGLPIGHANEAVFMDMLGLSREEFEALRCDHVI
jgi:succinyl-CoA---D-citramalate CoA-transferase